MPRLEFFVVAESAAVDVATNRLSIFNVVEEASAPSVAQAVAVAAWDLDADEIGREFQVIIRVLPPDGPRFDCPVNFRGEGARHRSVVRITGIPCFATGTLRFELLLNAEHKAEHRVTIIAAPPAGAPAVE